MVGTSFLKGALAGGVAVLAVSVASVALAGSGINGIFNLGVTNDVDETTTLQGSKNGPQLQVTNTNTGASAGGISVTSPGGAAAIRAQATAGGRGLNASSVDGVAAQATSTNATGVFGISTNAGGVLGRHGAATGTSPGVRGETNSTDAKAVGTLGVAPNGDGVLGTSTNGSGVHGKSNAANGVFGESSNAGASGVYGENFSQGYGVAGRTNDPSSSRAAVFGENVAAGVGVSGTAASGGTGVIGSTAGTGVGVVGASSGVAAVQGLNFSTGDGVEGISSGNAVHGKSFAANGVFGESSVAGASGVYGENLSGGGYGVAGRSNATDQTLGAVYGENTTYGVGVRGKTAASGIGVLGTTNRYGIGVKGEVEAGDGVSGVNDPNSDGNGVHGTSSSTNTLFGGVLGESLKAGVGVRGTAAAGGFGVWGQVDQAGSIGVIGLSSSGEGVRGVSTGGLAGHFLGTVKIDGNLNVSGTVTKGGGAFRIDDPLDPAGKYLSHSFVESPDMLDVYDGNVRTDAHGYAVVRLPRYFQALNRDFRYQLTPIGRFAQAIVWKQIAGNRFTIRTDKPNVEVSWQVTGIRHDPYANAHRIVPEQAKPAADRGRYLHPELYGKPASAAVR